MRLGYMMGKGSEATWQGVKTCRAQLIFTAPCSRLLPLATHLPLLLWSTRVNRWNALTTRPSLVLTTPCGFSLSPACHISEEASGWPCIITFSHKDAGLIRSCSLLPKTLYQDWGWNGAWTAAPLNVLGTRRHYAASSNTADGSWARSMSKGSL